MTSQQPTSTSSESIDDRATERDDEDEYDLPIELFAGTVILIMGILVVLTPLTTEMPGDWVWSPTAMNAFGGTIYIVVGGFLLYRHRTLNN